MIENAIVILSAYQLEQINGISIIWSLQVQIGRTLA